MTRKIDKRACRKFAIPELEFNLNEGILHVERCPYIIRTAVHNISGQRILVLYIYQSENILAGSIKPRWVMFHSRDDFATLSFRENTNTEVVGWIRSHWIYELRARKKEISDSTDWRSGSILDGDFDEEIEAMDAIDEEINQRAWDQYNSEDHSNESYGVHREHGWYLPNDD